MKRKTPWNRVLALVLTLALALSLSTGALATGSVPEPGKDWTVALYLCGDPETNYGCITDEILEMLEADIPDSVNVLLMTGGAKTWDPYGKGAQTQGYVKPDADKQQIFRVDDEKMTLLGQRDPSQPDYAYMNDPDTVAWYMEFAQGYAPDVAHTMFIFWDHGGGPLTGAMVDEYSGGVMSSEGLIEAMNETAENLPGGKKYDMIGFVACLMGSVELAYGLRDAADYLLASEEVVPGTGYNFHWLNIFSEKENAADVTAKEVGQRIIDLYTARGDEENDPSDANWTDTANQTMALVDLSQMEDLMAAVQTFAEQLKAVQDDSEHPEKYAAVARAVRAAPSMHNRSCGLLDLYAFAYPLAQQEELGALAAAAQGVLDQLGTLPAAKDHTLCGALTGDSPAVVYRGVSPNYSAAAGLTIYYPETRQKMNETRATYYLSKYYPLKISDTYVGYLVNLIKSQMEQQVFRGELRLSMDPETYDYTMTVGEADIDSLTKVDAVTFYSDLVNQKTYYLGNRPVDGADWIEGEFLYKYDLSTISLQDQGFTYERTKDDGAVYTSYDIPILIEGNDYVSRMTMAVVDSLPGVGIILSIQDFDPDSEDVGVAVHSFIPGAEDEITFYPLLLELTPELANEHRLPTEDYASLTAKSYLKNKPITLGGQNQSAIAQWNSENERYFLEIKQGVMEGGPDKAFLNHFRVEDVSGNSYYSAPMAFLLIKDPHEELSIAPIAPQTYTGSPIKPELSLIYHSVVGDVTIPASAISNQLTITYERNTAPGTAVVKVYYQGGKGEGNGYLEPASFEIRSAGGYDDGGSSSGGSSTAATELSVTVSGDTATVKAPTDAQLNALLGEGEATGEITIDLSDSGSAVTAASIPAETVKAIEKAVSDPAKSAEELTVKLPGGSVTLDAQALKTVSEQAAGSDVTLELKTVNVTELNSAQQEAVQTMQVEVALEAALTSGGKSVADFGTGAATVRIPYPLKDGQQPGGIVVWYVDADGSKTEVPATYDGENIVFSVGHFSTYVIAYDGSRAAACPKDGTCPLSAYTDLDPASWYHDGVHWALENGVMQGLGGGVFQPDGTTTRAQVATILWNMEGKPAADGPNPFFDIPIDGDVWYADAVKWAAANGIVEGYIEGAHKVFGPDQPVTREQLVTMLYRYAQSKGRGFTGMWMFLLDFPDAADVSDWASEAMHWMVMQGVINGMDGKLNPKGSATRAQAASMLSRFVLGA